MVKSKGGRTAWADKHPAYDLVNGPSGKGVDDLYTPEITNVGGLDNTVSVDCTVANDELKVAGIINEINGLKHDGSPAGGTPAVFGMNFQAVSVGQKLANDNGTAAARRAPIPASPAATSTAPERRPKFSLSACRRPMKPWASMIQALKQRGIYNSTLFIVSAKHGQSPINPVKINKPGHFADLVATLPDAATNPGGIAIASAECLQHRRLRFRPGRRYRADLAAGSKQDQGCGRLSEHQRQGLVHR